VLPLLAVLVALSLPLHLLFLSPLHLLAFVHVLHFHDLHELLLLPNELRVVELLAQLVFLQLAAPLLILQLSQHLLLLLFEVLLLPQLLLSEATLHEILVKGLRLVLSLGSSGAAFR